MLKKDQTCLCQIITQIKTEMNACKNNKEKTWHMIIKELNNVKKRCISDRFERFYT